MFNLRRGVERAALIGSQGHLCRGFFDRRYGDSRAIADANVACWLASRLEGFVSPCVMRQPLREPRPSSQWQQTEVSDVWSVVQEDDEPMTLSPNLQAAVLSLFSSGLLWPFP